MAVGDKIPEEYRKKVADVYLYIKARLPHPPRAHLEYIFEAYNNYVESHNPQDINCRTNVARVLNIIGIYVKIWNQLEENLHK